MKVSKHLSGAIVAIKFEDHSVSDEAGEIVKCIVYGEIFKITPKHLVVRYWQCEGSLDNDEYVNIIKAAIKSIEVLKKAPEGEPKKA